jgi:phasin family protein
MTTIRQLIQTSPIKANELLAKLADTSDSAIKTRERLFTELKEEMELLASLEEEHLFPVLRKHKETRGLVSDALADNRQTRKLLAELEEIPKESEDFASKVTELRKVFQQHVRDEKKEFLPAVLKALSDEDAQAIVEKIEAEKAGIEEAKRAETEQRRTEARQAREQVESAQRSAESVVDTVRAGTEEARKIARTAQDTLRDGLNTVTETAQRSTDEVSRMVSRTGEQVRDLTMHSSQTFAVMSEASAVLTRGMQDVSKEWLSVMQERLQKNMEALNALASCRSLPDLMAVQTELAREGLQQTITGARRIAEVTSRVTDEATRTVAAQTANATRRAA